MHFHGTALCLSVALAALSHGAMAQETEGGSAPLAITWDDARRDAAADSQQDPSAVRASRSSISTDVNSLPLPVILPGTDDGTLRGTPKVTAQPRTYVANITLSGGAKLTIFGSSLAREAPIDLAPALDNAPAEDFTPLANDDTGQDGADTDNDEYPTVDLSFSKYGAAYTFRLRCTRTNDPRCADRTFLEDLRETSITIVGEQQ